MSEEERSKTLAERFGLTMKHAGVAITITSVTDLLAFGVGASSSLPALRSFAGTWVKLTVNQEILGYRNGFLKARM